MVKNPMTALGRQKGGHERGVERDTFFHDVGPRLKSSSRLVRRLIL